jgi:hypothetical protein
MPYTVFVSENKLNGVDAFGSSIGARPVLELARRGGILGGVVSLDPAVFRQGWQIPYFYHSINLSIKLVRSPDAPQGIDNFFSYIRESTVNTLMIQTL